MAEIQVVEIITIPAKIFMVLKNNLQLNIQAGLDRLDIISELSDGFNQLNLLHLRIIRQGRADIMDKMPYFPDIADIDVVWLK